jgi:AraC family transcriptional regulator
MGHSRARKEYERRINTAIDFISRNLDKNPTLDDIAAAASFSKFHFHRLFQTYVGETVLEFTRRLRLEKSAAQLNFDINKDITSIALDCGFSSSQNFAKAFKKHFGISPTEYRLTGAYSRTNADSNNGNTLSNIGNTHRKHGNDGAEPIYHNSRSFENNQHGIKELIVTIEVKELPGINVAYVRTIGEYGFEPAKKAFQKLSHWAEPRELMEDGLWLGIAWDNPCVTPADKCRYDACVTVPDGTEVTNGADQQIVPAGKYAVHRTEVVNNDFQKGWDQLIGDWLPGSGFQPGDGPSYEVYIDRGVNDPEGRWVVDIHLPVKPL